MKTFKRTTLATISLAALMALNTATESQAQTSQSPVMKAEDSGTMQRSNKDMKRVLEKLQQLGAKPIGTQSVAETRQGPTPADAVKAVLKDDGKMPRRSWL
jgi:hypothetical protein